MNSILKTICVIVVVLITSFFTSAQPNSGASPSAKIAATINWKKLPSHPRVFANASRWEALREQVKNDSVSRQMYTIIYRRAIELLPQPPYVYRDMGAFLSDPVRQGQGRIMALAFTYRIERDPRFLARAKEEMRQLAALPDWYPQHFLETAEAAMGLGLGIDWLYHDLTVAERTGFAKIIVEKAFKPSLVTNGQNKWITDNNNWNQVCHGGLAVAALAIADLEPIVSRQIVARSLANLHFSADSYAPGGAYPEGPGYWSYGTRHQVLMAEALHSVFGKTFDVDQYPGFMATPDFVAHMSGSTGERFNYGDNGSNPRGYDSGMFWFARQLKRPDLITVDLAEIKKLYAIAASPNTPMPDDPNEDRRPFSQRSTEHHLPLALFYWDPALSAQPAAKSSRSLYWSSEGGIQPVVAMRTAWNDPRAIYVAFKGGTPRNSHADMDVGTFILEADGVRWAVDPGGQPYSWARSNGMPNAELFNNVTQASRRWEMFRKGPEGHNILRFDNGQQDMNGQAQISPARRLPASSAWVVALSSLYPQSTTTVNRGFALLPDRRVLIQDEWTAGAKNKVVTWQWLTLANVVIEKSGLVLRQNGETLRLRIVAPARHTIEVQDVSKPPQAFDSPNPGLSRIVISIPTRAGEASRLVVVAEPSEMPSSTTAPAIVPLREW